MWNSVSGQKTGPHRSDFFFLSCTSRALEWAQGVPLVFFLVFFFLGLLRYLLVQCMFESVHDVNGVNFFPFLILLIQVQTCRMHFCGCSKDGASEDVWILSCICSSSFKGNKVDVALIRIHILNENVILLILYMACVSGNFKSLTLMVFCTSFNSCLASWSCWSRCCSLSAVWGATACAVSVISVL